MFQSRSIKRRRNFRRCRDDGTVTRADNGIFLRSLPLTISRGRFRGSNISATNAGSGTTSITAASVSSTTGVGILTRTIAGAPSMPEAQFLAAQG